MAFTDFLTSGFVGLGNIFAQKNPQIGQAFQNSLAPIAKPFNTNTFSFDIGGSFQKLLDSFKPKPPAQVAKEKIFDTLGNSLTGILQAFGNKAISAIENGNTRPTEFISSGANSNDPIPSQSISSIAALLDFLRPAQPILSAPQEIIQESANQVRNSVFLVGGAAILLVLLATQRGK